MEEASRRSLADQFRWICQLCLQSIPDLGWNHKSLNPKRLSIDYMMPLSHGGSARLSNLQPVHAACNSAKNGRFITNEQFRTWKSQHEGWVPPDAPNRQIIWHGYSPSVHRPPTPHLGNDPEPRGGEWSKGRSVVNRLQRQLARAKLSEQQRERALRFLAAEHPFDLMDSCQRGHRLTLENTYFREEEGTIGRECRVCRRM
jgi:hypothetical protein